MLISDFLGPERCKAIGKTFTFKQPGVWTGYTDDNLDHPISVEGTLIESTIYEDFGVSKVETKDGEIIMVYE